MVTVISPPTASSLDSNLETFTIIHPATLVVDAAERLRLAPEKFALIGETVFPPLTVVAQIHLDALAQDFGGHRLEDVINKLPPTFIIFSGVELRGRKYQWYGLVMSRTATPGIIVWDETIAQISGVLPIEIIFERLEKTFDRSAFDTHAQTLCRDVMIASTHYKYVADDLYRQAAADVPMCVFICDADPPHLRIEVPDCSHPPSCPTHGVMSEI